MEIYIEDHGREIPKIGCLYAVKFHEREQIFVVRFLVWDNGVLNRVVLIPKHNRYLGMVYVTFDEWYKTNPILLAR